MPCLLQKRHFVSVFIFIFTLQHSELNSTWAGTFILRISYDILDACIDSDVRDSDVRDSEVRDFDVREGTVGLNHEYPTLLYLFTVQSVKNYCSKAEK